MKDEDQAREQSKRVRIGRNGQSGFWCGFCKKVVSLRSKGLEAWDERFDHIDDWHFKKGERIDEGWYPLESDVPKGLLRNDNVLDSGGLGCVVDESEDESSDGAQRDSLSPDKNAPGYDVNMAMESDSSSKQQRVWYCVSCFPSLNRFWYELRALMILGEIVHMQLWPVQTRALWSMHGRILQTRQVHELFEDDYQGE